MALIADIQEQVRREIAPHGWVKVDFSDSGAQLSAGDHHHFLPYDDLDGLVHRRVTKAVAWLDHKRRREPRPNKV